MSTDPPRDAPHLECPAARQPETERPSLKALGPALESRRDRVRRTIAKRPTISIEVTHRPCPDARARFIDLLVELLDEWRRSGGL